MNFNFPKCDLHFHLDGSMPPHLIWKLAKERNIDLPSDNFEEFRKYVEVDGNCRSLYDFLRCFSIPGKVLQDKAALEETAYYIVEEESKRGVVYLEIRFAPQLHVNKGLSQEEVVEAVIKGVNKAMNNNTNIKVAVILCAMVLGESEDVTDFNMETLNVAKKFLGRGVVALDLAGAEGMKPMESFRGLFEKANELGVPFTIHAGESMGPENIKTAISFGAKRIGHGKSAIESEEVMREIRDKGIILEMCVTSNIQCNVVKGINNHPIKKLYDYGIKVTVNTDDMAILKTDIDKEYEILINELGFTYNDLIKMNMYSIEGAFMEESEKERYLNVLKSYIKG